MDAIFSLAMILPWSTFTQLAMYCAAPQSWESALKSQGQVETKIFPHMLPHCAVHYDPKAISKNVANFLSLYDEIGLTNDHKGCFEY